MDSDKHITIEKIFFLQENCLNHTLPEVKDRYDFIKAGLELIINRNINTANLSDDTVNILNTIHSLLNDAVSNLIVAIKLSLYGACLEGLSLLRVFAETATIIAWKTEKKKFFEKVTFNTAKQQIKASDDISKLYKYLSKDIIHINNRNSKLAKFELNGNIYPRIGMALDANSTKIVLGELARATLYLVRILNDFYQSIEEINAQEFYNGAVELETKYSKL